MRKNLRKKISEHIVSYLIVNGKEMKRKKLQPLCIKG